MNTTSRTKPTKSTAGSHVPCACCKRYTHTSELSAKGACRDCAGELAAMDSRAVRMLETIGQGEDSY